MWRQRHLTDGQEAGDEIMELLSLSAVELGRAIKEGRTTAVEAMETVLSKIEETERYLNCYITVDGASALERAREVQAQIEAGVLAGPLAGFRWLSRIICAPREC